ncbi:MAG TPA: cyclase family protein [Bryobacteraceae bacterium]|nr:cyclase family protein [Bryobacteraceae bacterium]
MRELLAAIQQRTVYDLAQPYFVGMPHFPTHPPYLFGLTRKHGDLQWEGGVSSAADSIAFGSHVGTHIDALCHFACNGRLHGGIQASAVQSAGSGFSELGVDTIAPILRRGVLLDVAAEARMDALPADFSITPHHLDRALKMTKAEIQTGDVVLLRTGWARFFPDTARYLTGGEGGHAVTGPGPEIEAARWLSERGVFAAGSDTIAFEKVPAAQMPVHVHLLVENGIHIIEALDLEELSRNRIHEFVFVAAPLKIRGGTGSPLRPLALA